MSVKIGICLKSLGLSLRRGLEEVRRLGVGGVEVEAVGDLAPANLSHTGRREFRHLLKSHGLELTALACPLRHGLYMPANLQPRIETIQNVLALSYDLGPRIVIIQAGKIPDADGNPAADLLRESLQALGQFGDRVGATLALHTGMEAGERLRTLLDGIDAGSLAANFDPGNLLLGGFDVFGSAHALRERIVHVHARDARRTGRAEVVLGHGDIDWLALLGLLEEIGYRGWLSLVRDTGQTRLADIAAGVSFLRRFT
jgi:sugar phosphate isomerase/epimerase